MDTTFSYDETAQITPVEVSAGMMQPSNVDYLTESIFDKADPLRNSGYSALTVKDKVIQYLKAWQQLGKFDKLKNFRGEEIRDVSMVSTIQAFNQEFVNAFADKIINYDDPTKVKSMTNLNGLYAQQSHTLTTTGKQIPFYERALYRRLNDWNLDFREDETENMFYMMDHNPKLSDAERKKTNRDPEMDPSLDRVGMSFRMIPHY